MRFETAGADGKAVSFTTHLTPAEVEMVGTAAAAAGAPGAAAGAKAGGGGAAAASSGGPFAKCLADGDVFEVRRAAARQAPRAPAARGAFVRRRSRRLR